MQSKRELYQAAMRTVCARRQAARAHAEDARRTACAAIPALAAAQGISTTIINGRKPEGLYRVVEGKSVGTLFVGSE